MIRLINKEDIPSIVELETQTLGTTLGSEMLEGELTNPLSNIFVEYDDKVLGYVSTVFDGEVIEILNICVLPELQRRSVGSNLLNYLTDFYSKNNPTSIFLEVRASNSNAINFYLKHGFKEEYKRKGYYSNGEDALVMIKKL